MNCGPKLVLRPFLGKNPQENCQYILHLVGEGGVIHVQDVELTFFWARGVYYERTSWAYPHLVLHAKIYFSLNPMTRDMVAHEVLRLDCPRLGGVVVSLLLTDIFP